MNKTKRLLSSEMFPQLADWNNPRRYIDFIKVPDLRLFCEKCMEKAQVEPTDYTNMVSEYEIGRAHV